MQEFWDSFSQLLDAEALIRSGGFYLVIFIVFAETGLFFGFFLPGDYLLFLAGLLCIGHVERGYLYAVYGAFCGGCTG